MVKNIFKNTDTRAEILNNNKLIPATQERVMYHVQVESISETQS